MARNVTYHENPLQGSICANCKHMVCRTIVPLFEEDYGIYRDEMDIDAEEELYLEHYLCKEVGVDLDHVVLKCNFFERKGCGKFIDIDKY